MSVLALTFLGAGCTAGADKVIAIPSSAANGEAAIASKPVDLSALAELKKQAESQLAAPAAQSVQMADAGTGTAAKADASAKVWPRPTAPVGTLPAAETLHKIVRIQTDKGEIVFDVLDKEGPLAASNFIALARSGYYDGLTFHRIVPHFVIQGGDPKGDGTGGPGYTIAEDPVTLNYDAGIVAMAKTSAPHSTGSQFFIMTDDAPSLPKEYSIFGRIRSGMDVVRKIAIGDRMNKVTVEDAE
jgi:peptidyl-prolyl cis-trans isomerase B (cyclophilin B)